MPNRFRVAFSFAGEKRLFVAEVAKLLAKRFGEQAILYDGYHVAELSRADLAFHLTELYNTETDLVVVVVCKHYEEKRWCGLEWLTIHDRIFRGQGHEVMLCHFDLATLPGLPQSAGFVDLDNLSPQKAADLILLRLSRNDELSKKKRIQHRYGHPYATNVEELRKLGNRVDHGQIVLLLGTPGLAKTLLLEEAARRVADKRTNVWINVTIGSPLDLFEDEVRCKVSGESGGQGSFDDLVFALPKDRPLFLVIDAFHCYFAESSQTTEDAFRLWPQKLRALSLNKPHIIVLCGSMDPLHLYKRYGVRMNLGRGSWNLTPNRLILKPNFQSWFQRLSEVTGVPLSEVARLGVLAEGRPGVLAVGLDALDFGNSPDGAIAAAHETCADEIMLAAPPCCRHF